MSRSFRDFDYQLGRRNCQRFLQTSFAVPAENPIVANWAPSVNRDKLRALSTDPNDLREPPTYVLIPLYGDAANEAPLPKWPRISQRDFETLQRRIEKRFDRVAPLIIQQSVSGFLSLLLVSRFSLGRTSSSILSVAKFSTMYE